jgi:hypothetical protein
VSGAGYGAPMGEGVAPAALPRHETYAPSPQQAPEAPLEGMPSYEPKGPTPRWVVVFFLLLATLPFASCAACTCTGVVVGAALGRAVNVKP